MRKRKILGVQLHHSVNLSDAVRGGANMCAGLRGAITCTGDPELHALLEEANDLVRRVSRAHGAAHARLLSFHDHPDFTRMRDGELPWPDETLGAFEARCSCYDSCLVHDHDVKNAPAGQCNCDDVCPAHPEARAA